MIILKYSRNVITAQVAYLTSVVIPGLKQNKLATKVGNKTNITIQRAQKNNQKIKL